MRICFTCGKEATNDKRVCKNCGVRYYCSNNCRDRDCDHDSFCRTVVSYRLALTLNPKLSIYWIKGDDSIEIDWSKFKRIARYLPKSALSDTIKIKMKT